MKTRAQRVADLEFQITGLKLAIEPLKPLQEKLDQLQKQLDKEQKSFDVGEMVKCTQTCQRGCCVEVEFVGKIVSISFDQKWRCYEYKIVDSNGVVHDSGNWDVKKA